MAQGRNQKFFFTGFWHFIEFCLYLLQPFNNDIIKYSRDWFYFKHLGECSCQKTSFCHIFSPPIGSKRHCTESCLWSGVPEGTWGQTFAWSLGFLCRIFSAISFACFPLSASVCYCNLFLRWHLFWGENAFLKMKLNKVSYKSSHLFSI